MASGSPVDIHAIDSVSDAPRRIQGLPNYRSETIDFANNFLPFGPSTEPTYDFIRCTRLLGKARSWSELCYKLFRHTKPGSPVEIFDVVANSIRSDPEKQPTWSLIPGCVNTQALLCGLEMPDIETIKQYLEGAGFVDVVQTTRRYHLDWENDDHRSHINGLVREGLLALGGCGMISGHPETQLNTRDCLRSEAEHGLVFRRYA